MLNFTNEYIYNLQINGNGGQIILLTSSTRHAIQGKYFFKCAKFHKHLCKLSSRSEYRANPDTSASTIFNFFKFPKPLRACLQQLVKI